MDYGGSGVYDSPMALDYYVKRFGFMFGGGWSGTKGLMAIKATSEQVYPPSLPRTMYNPSGFYSIRGARGMEESVAKFQHPKNPIHATIYNKVQQKKMVKLSPMMVDMKQGRKPRMFSRFMAVP